MKNVSPAAHMLAESYLEGLINPELALKRTIEALELNVRALRVRYGPLGLDRDAPAAVKRHYMGDATRELQDARDALALLPQLRESRKCDPYA